MGQDCQAVPADERAKIRKEFREDVWECVYGITLCTASVAATSCLFGRHWVASGVWVAVAIVAFALFVRRWLRRGIFHALTEAGSGAENLKIE